MIASGRGRRREPRRPVRPFSYDEIAKWGEVNLGLFWLKDNSLEDSEHLLEPDVLAQEIAEDLQRALAQFAAIAGELQEGAFFSY